MLFSARFKSKQSEVSRIVEEAERTLSDAGFEADLAAELILILAEALNNVVEHAYQYKETGDIALDLDQIGQEVLVYIVDSGPAFEKPSETSMGPQSDVIEDLPEGGFGWGLIEVLADRVSLERIREKNHLRLYKTI